MVVLQALLWGAALALCAVPFAWSVLFPLPLAALFFLTAHSDSPRAAFMRMFWAGTAYFAGHLLWLPLSFASTFGPAAVSFVGLWLLEGLFVGLLAALCVRLTRRPGRRIWLLAFGWPLLEWLRHLGPLAFPWGTVGYTLSPTPLAQTADLGGVFLLSVLVTALAGALARAYMAEWRPLLGVGAVWALALVYGQFGSSLERNFVRPDGSGNALLVQGNVDARAKNDGTLSAPQVLALYSGLSKAAQPGDLVVWPEAAIDGAFVPISQPKFAAQLPTKGIIGYGGLTSSGARANRVFSWDGRVRGAWDKHVLVPLGEYFPLQRELPGVWSALFRLFGYPNGLLSLTSEQNARALPLGQQRFGAYICYESVFPQVSRGAVLSGAGVLVNVSNDGWFGVGQGIDQHFEMGRLRAIETRRYILRAGNVGVTAIIDQRGNVLEQLPRFQPGTLRGAYQSFTGETPYVRLGDWPLLLAAALFIWTLAKPRRFEFGL